MGHDGKQRGGSNTLESRAQHFSLKQQHTRTLRPAAAHRIVIGMTSSSASRRTRYMNMVHFGITTMVRHHNARPDLNDQNTQQKCQYAVL